MRRVGTKKAFCLPQDFPPIKAGSTAFEKSDAAHEI
jgi:hypothetical protein